MINPGFKISSGDVIKFNKFKQSAAYGTYLNAISKSPAFTQIMSKSISNIDISPDIEFLKSKGKMPTEIQADTLNSLFKQSISRMAICLVADAIIIREIEDNSIDEVINGIKKDSDILYLLGLAETKYYVEAKKQIEEGKIKDSDLIYRGYAAWLKNHSEEELGDNVEKSMTTQPKATAPTKDSSNELVKAIKRSIDNIDVE